MNIKCRFILLFFSWIITLETISQKNAPNPNQTYKVIGILDGDTYDILIDNQSVRIRVDGIDAPEKGMPFSKVSKKYLSKLCFEKFIKIKKTSDDGRGRWVCRGYTPEGLDISEEMIRAGLAWHYKKFSSDIKLAELEVEARSKKIGLWTEPNPIAPWEIRKLHKKGISTKEYFKNSVK
jgi:micrococcal nuclease